MVMVKRSLVAANAIRAGKTRSRARSSIMGVGSAGRWRRAAAFLRKSFVRKAKGER
jgi:hypothetical protein